MRKREDSGIRVFYGHRTKYLLKKNALAGAKVCRKTGYKTRIIKEDGFWILYIRKGQT